jgi:hypothetical protein
MLWICRKTDNGMNDVPPAFPIPSPSGSWYVNRRDSSRVESSRVWVSDAADLLSALLHPSRPHQTFLDQTRLDKTQLDPTRLI